MIDTWVYVGGMSANPAAPPHHPLEFPLGNMGQLAF